MVTAASEATKEDAMNHDDRSVDFQVGDLGTVFLESRLRETDDQLAEARHKNQRLVPNTTNPDDWAKIAGKKGERIVAVKVLVGEARQQPRGIERALTTGT